ncbi:MAG: Ig-like domain-containing protein [Anaerolineae bacterium]|nr:Ig-like domain-containing protein [Anaerolineae bacterium]
MKRHLGVVVALLAALVVFPGFGLIAKPVVAAPAAPQGLDPAYVESAAQWMLTQQQAGGGFGSVGSTAQAVLALTAAGIDPTEVVTGANSVLDYLALHADTFSGSGWDPASQTALLVQAVVAAGKNPYDFGGVNLVKRLNGYYQADTGSFGQGNWALSSYIIALDALNMTVPVTAVNTLKSGQLHAGAWEYMASWGADPDTTGMALQALAVTNEPLTSTTFISATAYFSGTQKPHGGWNTAFDSGETANPNSTALAVQGLLAAGVNPLTYTVSISGFTPIDALLQVRNAETGAFQFSGVDSLMATLQVIPAIAGHTYPYYGQGVASHAAITYLDSVQQADGGFPGFWGTSSGATLDAVLGAVAAGFDPRDWTVAGLTPLDYLAAGAVGYTTPSTSTWESIVYTTTAVAQTGKLVVGVVAAEAYTMDMDTAYFAGLSLKELLDDRVAWSPRDNTLNDQAWAALGYAALGETVPSTLTQALLNWQEPNGGWSYYGDYAYGTSLAVQALVSAGIAPTRTEMLSATAFIHSLQAPTGGFVSAPPATTIYPPANVVATANILQAIAALDLTPADFTISASEGLTLPVNSPDQWLMSRQSVVGDFEGTASATGQTLQGMAGLPLPLHFRPAVISTSLQKRLDVPQKGPFIAVFNTELDPTTVNSGTFTIQGPNGTVESIVGYAGRTAVLTPTTKLDAGVIYRLAVDGVKSARFGAASVPYHWDVITAYHEVYLPLLIKS